MKAATWEIHCKTLKKKRKESNALGLWTILGRSNGKFTLMLTKELEHNFHIALSCISKRGDRWIYTRTLALWTAYQDHDKDQQSEHRGYLVHLSAALVVFHSVHELDVLLDTPHCGAGRNKTQTKKKRLFFCLKDEWLLRCVLVHDKSLRRLWIRLWVMDPSQQFECKKPSFFSFCFRVYLTVLVGCITFLVLVGC